jgi:Fe-S-cluster-containing hydrogenase component 2
VVLYVTVQRCAGCGKCELACAFAHGRDGIPGTARIHVIPDGRDRGMPLTCLQCHEAACVAVCPTGALARDESTGAITLLAACCLRCGLCVAACPFGNMLWDETARGVAKCDLCGGTPRCVPFCSTRALEYVPEGPHRKDAEVVDAEKSA